MARAINTWTDASKESMKFLYGILLAIACPTSGCLFLIFFLKKKLKDLQDKSILKYFH